MCWRMCVQSSVSDPRFEPGQAFGWCSASPPTPGKGLCHTSVSTPGRLWKAIEPLNQQESILGDVCVWGGGRGCNVGVERVKRTLEAL